jgi:NAD(P)-dependent dehydrogenase (short-subunit alcohol dehydrogenase family)
MTGLLAGKVAAVTGGARGLGAAICALFREAGAVAVALDIAGPEPCDVTEEASVAAALARVVASHGRLDAVVCNAGVVPPWRGIAALDLDEWDRVFAVNVRGVAATMKAAVPHLAARGGAIVAMSSIMGYRAHPGQAAYVASKHAVVGLVRAAALDLGRYGIRVNAIGPGSVATEALLSRMAARAAAGIAPAVGEALAAAAKEPALGRMVTEQDVARAALYLASDLSSGVTGQILPVEGGLA